MIRTVIQPIGLVLLYLGPMGILLLSNNFLHVSLAENLGFLKTFGMYGILTIGAFALCLLSFVMYVIRQSSRKSEKKSLYYFFVTEMLANNLVLLSLVQWQYATSISIFITFIRFFPAKILSVNVVLHIYKLIGVLLSLFVWLILTVPVLDSEQSIFVLFVAMAVQFRIFMNSTLISKVWQCSTGR